MQEIDGHTLGRPIEVSCDKLVEVVEKDKLKVFAFFGPHKDITRGGEWFHFVEMATADRRMIWQEPIYYVYNDEEECRKKYGGEDGVIILGAFNPGYEPKFIHIVDQE